MDTKRKQNSGPHGDERHERHGEPQHERRRTRLDPVRGRTAAARHPDGAGGGHRRRDQQQRGRLAVAVERDDQRRDELAGHRGSCTRSRSAVRRRHLVGLRHPESRLVKSNLLTRLFQIVSINEVHYELRDCIAHADHAFHGGSFPRKLFSRLFSKSVYDKVFFALYLWKQTTIWPPPACYQCRHLLSKRRTVLELCFGGELETMVLLLLSRFLPVYKPSFLCGGPNETNQSLPAPERVYQSVGDTFCI